MTTDWRLLIDLADRLEPASRKAFIEAVERIREALDVEAIAKAITGGDFGTAATLVDIGAIRHALEPVQGVSDQAFYAAGTSATRELNQALRLSLRFDVTNPFAVTYAQTQAAALVTGVGAETEAAIRSIVMRSFTEGLTWREAASLIRPLIGLTARDAAAVLNYRASLLKTSVPTARVELLAERYADKKLRQRAQSIARTEIMAASNYGALSAWKDAIQKGFLPRGVMRSWAITPDDRLCPSCEQMADQRRAMNEWFETPDGGSIEGPPLHTQCRCVVVLDVGKTSAKERV